jgi:hypothetical protein
VTRACLASTLLALLIATGCASIPHADAIDTSVGGARLHALYVDLAGRRTSSDCIPILSRHLASSATSTTIADGEILFATGTSLHADLSQWRIRMEGRLAVIVDPEGQRPAIPIKASDFRALWRAFDPGPSAVDDGHNPGHANCFIAARNSGGALKMFSAPLDLPVSAAARGRASRIAEMINRAADGRF